VKDCLSTSECETGKDSNGVFESMSNNVTHVDIHECLGSENEPCCKNKSPAIMSVRIIAKNGVQIPTLRCTCYF
jgi:hypothetical protein